MFANVDIDIKRGELITNETIPQWRPNDIICLPPCVNLRVDIYPSDTKGQRCSRLIGLGEL